jgi:hypothetical protein
MSVSLCGVGGPVCAFSLANKLGTRWRWEVCRVVIEYIEKSSEKRIDALLCRNPEQTVEHEILRADPSDIHAMRQERVSVY